MSKMFLILSVIGRNIVAEIRLDLVGLDPIEWAYLVSANEKLGQVQIVFDNCYFFNIYIKQNQATMSTH